MWQLLDNTQYSLTSPTTSKYEQSDRQGETIEIFNRCFDFMWCFYGKRRSEKFKKALDGALKFFPGIICFQSLVVKRKDYVLGVWKSLIYQLRPKQCPITGFTRPGQRRRCQCFRYLSSDLQHPAVKRVLLL